MVKFHPPIFCDQKAVVEKISTYHAHIRLKEGPAAGSEHSVFVNAIRLSGDLPVIRLDDKAMKIGQTVRAFYTDINGNVIMLFLVAGDGKQPNPVEVEKKANALMGPTSKINDRLVKSIEADEMSVTPASCKSAISVPSPINVRDILVDDQQSAGDTVKTGHVNDSDASR